MEADMVMVNIIKSEKSKAVLKIRVGFMQLNTLLVECWAEKTKQKTKLGFIPIFITSENSAERPHSKHFLMVAAEILWLKMGKYKILNILG